MFGFPKKNRNRIDSPVSDNPFAVMNSRSGLTREEAAAMLGTDPELLAAFEDTYQRHTAAEGVSDNWFKVSAKEMKDLMEQGKSPVATDKELRNRIVEELLAQTETLYWDGRKFTIERFETSDTASLPAPITSDEIKALPEPMRPQLTGSLMRRDMGNEHTYPMLLMMYKQYLNETNLIKKKQLYGCFRQGLDILDLDAVTYELIGTNPTSIGNWLPAIATAAVKEGFFQVPKTRVVKVPLTLLQLTRLDYSTLTPATLEIVDEWTRRAFSLEPDGDYFVKTGTYSSKFDFRNAHVHGEEVKDLGQYLLFIHAQAISYAHYDLSGRKQPVVYGMSTTNEWAVREFIPSQSDAIIYHGMPLRTEYRIFVDFDTCQIIGKSPYWEPETMKTRFERSSDAAEADQIHDSLIYRMAEPELMKTYEQYVDTVCGHIALLLPDAAKAGLSGQWSIDVMQEDDRFYIIDMAVAELSAFYDCVPKTLRSPMQENWLPDPNVLKPN